MLIIHMQYYFVNNQAQLWISYLWVLSGSQKQAQGDQLRGNLFEELIEALVALVRREQDELEEAQGITERPESLWNNLASIGWEARALVLQRMSCQEAGNWRWGDTRETGKRNRKHKDYSTVMFTDSLSTFLRSYFKLNSFANKRDRKTRVDDTNFNNYSENLLLWQPKHSTGWGPQMVESFKYQTFLLPYLCQLGDTEFYSFKIW